MRKMKHSEWLQEARSRFGDNNDDWKFVCPSCGKISSIADFKKIGIAGIEATQNCIGRFSKEEGCNWAAYGFFKTLGKGVEFEFENGTVEVFAFAEKEIQSNGAN